MPNFAGVLMFLFGCAAAISIAFALWAIIFAKELRGTVAISYPEPMRIRSWVKKGTLEFRNAQEEVARNCIAVVALAILAIAILRAL